MFLGSVGLQKNWINVHEHENGKQYLVNTYINVNLLYPDACYADAPMGSQGACKYAVMSGFTSSMHYFVP